MGEQEDVLRLLREIKDAQDRHHSEWQELVRGTKDAQDRRHSEWQDAVRRAEEQQQRAVLEVAKAKRWSRIVIAALIAVLVGIYCLPLIWGSRRSPAGFPEMARYSNPIPTPGFDGSYVLDTEESFSDLRARLAEAEPRRREALQRLLAMSAEQFESFRINHGVITSGRTLVQEFRVVSATTEGEVLRGRAIWHEDVHDPGDCCAINVRLALKGDVLEFAYYPDGEEPGPPIVMRRNTPQPEH